MYEAAWWSVMLLYDEGMAFAVPLDVVDEVVHNGYDWRCHFEGDNGKEVARYL